MPSLKEMLTARRAEEEALIRAKHTVAPVAQVATVTTPALVEKPIETVGTKPNEETKSSGFAALRARTAQKAEVREQPAEEKVTQQAREVDTPQSRPSDIQPPVPSGADSFRAKLGISAGLSKPAITLGPEPPKVIPAVAPAVEVNLSDVPDEHKLQVETLRRNLIYLADNIEQKEIVGNVVRTLFVQMREYPWVDNYASDADFNLVMRGARRAFNIAARQKVEARGKKAVKNELTDKVDAMFKNFSL